MRLCDHCLVSHERRTLTKRRGRWICDACAALPAGPVVDARAAGERPRAERTLHERIEHWLRWGLLVGRGLLYLFFFWAGQRDATMRHVFQGFLIADAMTWLVKSLFELRHVRLVLLFEFFGYLAFMWLFYQLPGALTLPERGEDRAIVGLVFMGLFSVRVTYHAMRWRLGLCRGPAGEQPGTLG